MHTRRGRRLGLGFISLVMLPLARLHAASDLGWEAAIGLRVDIDGPCTSEVQSKSASQKMRDKGCKVKLLVTVSGTVEAENSGFDRVSVNGVALFEGDNDLQGCGATSTKTATASIEVGPGESITLNYDTVDELYNDGGLYASITNIVEDPIQCSSCSGGGSGSSSSGTAGGGTSTFGGTGWGQTNTSASVSTAPASFGVGLGSGSTAYGTEALYADANPSSASSGSRDGVDYVGPDEDHVAERFSDAGGLAQVKSAGGLVNLADSTGGYTLSFYAPAKIGSINATTGLYDVTGTADKVIAVSRLVSGTVATVSYTETVGSGTPVVLLANSYDSATQTRTVSEFDGLRTTETTRTSLSGSRTELRTTVKGIVNSVEKTYSVKSDIYQTFAWGDELVETADDPDGADTRTTYTFYTDAVNDGDNHGQLMSMVTTDGAWTIYRDYDSDGIPHKTVRQFASNAYDAGTSGESANWVETLTITSADEDADSLPDETQKTERYLKGQLVSRSWVTDYTATASTQLTGPDYYFGYSGTTRRRVTEQAADASTSKGDSANSKTTELVDTVTNRTVVSTDGNGVATISVNEFLLSDSSGVALHALTGQGALDGSGNLTSGWMRTQATDDYGNVTTYVYDAASGSIMFSQIPTNFDNQGRARNMIFGDGSYEEYVYGCCGLDEKRNRDGSYSTFLRDGMKRVTEEIVTVNGAFVRDTITTLDPLNRVVSTGRRPSATGPVQITGQTEYDLAGRINWTKDALERTTSYAYSTDSSDRLVTTTTYPGGGTRVETNEQDGSLRSIGGTAEAPRRFADDVDSTGLYHMEYLIDDIGGETEWIRTDYDFQGRSWKTSFPYPTGTASYIYHNSGGQVIRTVDPDGVTMLYAYDSAGRTEYQAVDMNGNNEIDLNGTDRVARYAYDVEYVSGMYGQRVTTYVLTTDGGTAERQTQRRTTRYEDGGMLKQVDPSGSTTRSFEYRTHDVKLTEVSPSGQTTETVLSAGQTVTQLVKASSVTLSDSSYSYDVYNRLETVTDASFGTTTYGYYDDDQIHTVTTPDPDATRSGSGYDPQVTTYQYDDAGLLWKTTLPDTRVETRTYYPTKKLKLLSGGDNYPQRFTYDAQGRIKTLTTWQTYDPATGSGTGAAITTWNYQPQRGWLEGKRYNDDLGPDYTYTAAGRLETRTWARGIVTTYGYNDAGDRESIDYSDSTPDVGFTYDREGRPATVTDATGLLTRTYNGLGQLDDETYAGTGLLSGQAISRGFDTYLRPQTLAFGSNYTVTWGYGTDTRLSTITQSQGNFSATYGYRPSSTLINSVTYKEGSTVRGSVGSTFDAIRRVARVDTLAGTTLVARRDYTYDDANRRVRTEHEDGRKWGYGYDGKGQVTSAVKTLANDDPLPGYSFGFTFDDIGNRKTGTINGREESYTADLLNRYERRTVSPAVDVRGTAATDATILVNDLPTVRTGNDFYRATEVDNQHHPVNAEIKVQAVRLGPPTSVATETRGVRVETGTLLYSYDDDGNQLGWGLWAYEWDGENRLVAAQISEAVQGTVSGLPKYRLEFAYDGFSRRISKTVKEWNDGTSTWNITTQTLYLYDGWNKIAELDALNSSAVLRSYVWGMDLSGSAQGAGGVGGLLWANDSSGNYAAGYDGNGNVIAWIKLTDGTLVGTQEYGPFGETLASTGAGRTLPVGFSTKFVDPETKLYDYGFRYYNPGTGRWLSRDPISERGGVNLYGMVKNNPIYWFDPFGLRACSEIKADIDALNRERDLTNSGLDALDNVAGGREPFFVGPNTTQQEIDDANARGEQVIGVRGTATVGGDTETLARFELNPGQTVRGLWYHLAWNSWGLFSGGDFWERWAEAEKLRHQDYLKDLNDALSVLWKEYDDNCCSKK